MTASYGDRYGPLGIVVTWDHEALTIETWVMSCRAFLRRVEHHCLQYLFATFEVDQITAAYQATDRNHPLRLFLGSLIGRVPDGPVGLTRRDFAGHAPALVHRISETAG